MIRVNSFNCNNPKITDCFASLGHHKIEHFRLHKKILETLLAARVDVS